MCALRGGGEFETFVVHVLNQVPVTVYNMANVRKINRPFEVYTIGF